MIQIQIWWMKTSFRCTPPWSTVRICGFMSASIVGDILKQTADIGVGAQNIHAIHAKSTIVTATQTVITFAKFQL